MNRNLFALAAILGMQAASLEVSAACTAGFPISGVSEYTPTSAFTDHGNGTVTHSLTGLMWKQCAQGSSGVGCGTGTSTLMTWSAALASAVADTTAMHGDWRLPNQKELDSIVELCGTAPAINRTLFPNTPVTYFWSGTSSAPAPANAWLIQFSSGDAFANVKTGVGYVRLVRRGQSFDSFDAQAPGDFIPSPFSFTAQTDVALSAVTTSNNITVTGIDTASPISIVGGSYSINSSLYTTVTGAVNNGDTVTLRQTSSANYGTMTTTTLTIGGVSGAFDVTTQAAPTLNVFDVDGNGQVDALTDGLILIRYMFGLRGAPLTVEAIGAGATRDAAEIEAYIQSVMPQ